MTTHALLQRPWPRHMAAFVRPRPVFLRTVRTQVLTGEVGDAPRAQRLVCVHPGLSERPRRIHVGGPSVRPRGVSLSSERGAPKRLLRRPVHLDPQPTYSIAGLSARVIFLPF